MKCPGSEITITIKQCPHCGEDVELFTGDSKVKCSKCGTWVLRDRASCIDWCPGAKVCFKEIFAERGKAEAKGKQKADA